MTQKLVPKRRFKEFIDDGAWEQRKLTDFVDFYNGLTYSPNNIRRSGTLVIRSSNVSNGEIINADNVYVDSTVVNAPNVCEGDIIIVVRNGSRALIGKHAQVKRSMPNSVVGAFMTGVRSECPEFLNALLDTPHFDKEIAMNMGATINQITGYMFSRMEFMIPKSEEQIQLGTFFNNLDNLITLQQRKLEKTKNLKSAYLSKMFPKEGENYPELRFAGFTEAWEQRELGSVAIIRTGYPFDSNDFMDNGEYLVITNGNIQHDSPIVDNSLGNRIDVCNAIFIDYILNRNDILVTMDGTVGRTAKVVEQGQILAQRVGRLTAKSDPEFLYQLLNTGEFFEKMTLLASGGTIKHISLSDIGSHVAIIPLSIDEQVKIGTFFKSMDTLITLHQRKLDKLKNIKQAYLNDMFV